MRVYLTKAEIALVKRWARENTEMDKLKGVVSDNKRVCLNPADRMETLERRIWNAETKEEEQRLESEMYGIESQMLGKGEPDGW